MVSFSRVSFLSVQLPLLILVTCLALNREYFPSYSMLAFNVELDIVILNDVTHDHMSFKQRDFYLIHLILSVVRCYYIYIYMNKGIDAQHTYVDKFHCALIFLLF